MRPDGKIVDFDGELFEKVVAKHKQLKFPAKAFTLPDVQVGSVIEYKYKAKWKPIPATSFFDPFAAAFLRDLGPECATQWIIQADLFTRRANCSFSPAPGPRLSYTWFGLPGTTKPEIENGTVKLAVENIPPFEEEEYMPPEETLRSRVDFFYLFSAPPKVDTGSADWFWKQQGEKSGKAVESFIGNRKGVSRTVEEVTTASDSAETKLRKLYGRAQQIRNLSYEREKTEKEEKREKFKDDQNVDEVLKHGYVVSE